MAFKVGTVQLISRTSDKYAGMSIVSCIIASLCPLPLICIPCFMMKYWCRSCNDSALIEVEGNGFTPKVLEVHEKSIEAAYSALLGNAPQTMVMIDSTEI